MRSRLLFLATALAFSAPLSAQTQSNDPKIVDEIVAEDSSDLVKAAAAARASREAKPASTAKSTGNADSSKRAKSASSKKSSKSKMVVKANPKPEIAVPISDDEFLPMPSARPVIHHVEPEPVRVIPRPPAPLINAPVAPVHDPAAGDERVNDDDEEPR